MTNNTAWQVYTVGACLAAAKVGLFEAGPPSGTACYREMQCRRGIHQSVSWLRRALQHSLTCRTARLMRQLTCNNIFDEVEVGKYAHTRLSIAHSEHAGPMSGKRVYQVG
jgi:hypothetical protein